MAQFKARVVLGLSVAILALVARGGYVDAISQTRSETLPEQIRRLDRELAQLKSRLERVEVNDASPKVSPISFVDGSTSWRNKAGGVVVWTGATEDGGGHTLTYSRNARASYVGAGKSKDGVLVLYDSTGSKSVSMVADAGGGSQGFYNKAGARLAYLGAALSGDGLLMLTDSTGSRSAVIAGDAAGGWQRLYDKSGTELIYLGRASGGGGMVTINGVAVHDVAEPYPLSSREGVLPGTVMSISGAGQMVEPAPTALDKRVVGVISGAGGLSPGMVIGSRPDGSRDLPVAIAGRVYVRVVCEGGAIRIGDLLSSSSTRGVAMRVAGEALGGTIVGKALEPFDGTAEGLICMQVMLR